MSTRTGEKRIDQFIRRVHQSLDVRERMTGHAWLNEHEARIFTELDLRQPGHSIYRYSVPNENLSDAAQREPYHCDQCGEFFRSRELHELSHQEAQ